MERPKPAVRLPVQNRRHNAPLKDIRPRANPLSLPTRLATELFANAKPVRLAADEVLFHAGDSGDGCYRIEEGLLKITMPSC
jgi:CRP-like cAMP-binding protein